MKVSIITATYNSEDTINDTLQSLNNQTYSNIEYIIIDGASTDNTLDVIKQGNSRVASLVSEPDNGIYDALNKGIKIATGDIIGFLHSDDLFAYPNAVEDIVETFNNYDTDAVYADLEYVKKENVDNIVRLWVSGNYNRNRLRHGWMPAHPTFYMKRSCYEEFGSFDLSFHIASDYDSILRYLWENKATMSYLPKVTIKMRIGGASNRSLKNIFLKTKEDIQALKNSDIPWLWAVLIKNFSKLSQFIKRK